MRRSVPTAVSLLLVLAATAGCGGQDAAKSAAAGATAPAPATSTPPAPPKVPALTADEALAVVKDLNQHTDVDNYDAEFWKGLTEGPLLEQQLGVVETTKKYGTDTPPAPTNSPDAATTVHAWTVGNPDGTDRWILGAQEAVTHTVGDKANKAVLYWSLFHQTQKDAPWRKTFLARAPEATALPEIATGEDGQAKVGGDAASLALDPATACGRFADYLHGRTDADGVKWSKGITELRADLKASAEDLRGSKGASGTVDLNVDSVRTPHGPVWRTPDGGALVACTSVSNVRTKLGPGRSETFSSSGWPGTTGIRWAAYTQRIMGLTMVKIPAAGAGEVTIGASSNLPHSFEGTKYQG
ncbi:hypothetical protein AB0P15_02785 [Streptomyces sp. NPDC087917]|uniref:hypothetical protein n=1 Tax=Streptomyces sp. NPDC087917 TaxID=3155060 RepID=UPI00342FE87E